MRNPVRRTFTTQSATSTTIGVNMIDLTIVSEIAATADSQHGDVLVTGMALVDLTDQVAIHQMVLWVGRTSTEPAIEDIGVRTRQFGANEIGTLFVLRFRGLRVDPGQLMKCVTQPIAESNSTVVHKNTVSVKWSYRELRQG